MTDSVETAFIQGVAQLLQTTIYPALSSYLKEQKETELSWEEFRSCLKLPAKTTSSTSHIVPGILTGVSSALSSTIVKNTRKKATATEDTGLTCQYVFTKGHNPGTVCGKKATDTSLGPRCRTHENKPGKTSTGEKSEKKSNVSLASLSHFPVPSQPQGFLETKPLDGTHSFYEPTGAVLIRTPEGKAVVIGISSNEAGKFPLRKLTLAEVKQHTELGLIVRDDAIEKAERPVVPSLPNGIPSLAGLTLPPNLGLS